MKISGAFMAIAVMIPGAREVSPKEEQQDNDVPRPSPGAGVDSQRDGTQLAKVLSGDSRLKVIGRAEVIEHRRHDAGIEGEAAGAVEQQVLFLLTALRYRGG